jgi:hypothetical protein
MFVLSVNGKKTMFGAEDIEDTKVLPHLKGRDRLEDLGIYGRIILK